MSSMLGCVAAVMAMVSPSHPRPAVIHKTSISAIGGVEWVVLGTGPPVCGAHQGKWRRDYIPPERGLRQARKRGTESALCPRVAGERVELDKWPGFRQSPQNEEVSMKFLSSRSLFAFSRCSELSQGTGNTKRACLIPGWARIAGQVILALRPLPSHSASTKNGLHSILAEQPSASRSVELCGSREQWLF